MDFDARLFYFCGGPKGSNTTDNASKEFLSSLRKIHINQFTHKCKQSMQIKSAIKLALFPAVNFLEFAQKNYNQLHIARGRVYGFYTRMFQHISQVINHKTAWHKMILHVQHFDRLKKTDQSGRQLKFVWLYYCTANQRKVMKKSTSLQLTYISSLKFKFFSLISYINYVSKNVADKCLQGVSKPKGVMY